MDAVADFRAPVGAARARAAIDLTEDPAILTAIATDIGIDAVFSRQLIAYASPATRCSRCQPRATRAT